MSVTGRGEARLGGGREAAGLGPAALALLRALPDALQVDALQPHDGLHLALALGVLQHAQHAAPVEPEHRLERRDEVGEVQVGLKAHCLAGLGGRAAVGGGAEVSRGGARAPAITAACKRARAREVRTDSTSACTISASSGESDAATAARPNGVPAHTLLSPSHRMKPFLASISRDLVQLAATDACHAAPSAACERARSARLKRRTLAPAARDGGPRQVARACRHHAGRPVERQDAPARRAACRR